MLPCVGDGPGPRVGRRGVQGGGEADEGKHGPPGGDIAWWPMSNAPLVSSVRKGLDEFALAARRRSNGRPAQDPSIHSVFGKPFTTRATSASMAALSSAPYTSSSADLGSTWAGSATRSKPMPARPSQ